MKKQFFPSALNVNGRSCLVIGDNEEAQQKAETLKKAGALVQLKREFNPDDLLGQFFVMFCYKDDAALTQHVAGLCRQQKILICAIDQPDFCDVVNVSFYERGPLKIMISTDGVAPALSKKIRMGLEESLKDVPLEKYMDDLLALRGRLEKEIPDLAERRTKLIEAVKDFEFKVKISGINQP